MYTRNSRIMEIQSELSDRTLELLALPDDGVPRLLLDIAEIHCQRVGISGLVEIFPSRCLMWHWRMRLRVTFCSGTWVRA